MISFWCSNIYPKSTMHLCAWSLRRGARAFQSMWRALCGPCILRQCWDGSVHWSASKRIVSATILAEWIGNERARSAIHDEPGKEGARLMRVESIDFKHCYWVRPWTSGWVNRRFLKYKTILADWFIPESVYPQLDDSKPSEHQNIHSIFSKPTYLRKLSPNTFMKLLRIFGLGGNGLHIVDYMRSIPMLWRSDILYRTHYGSRNHCSMSL